MNQILIPLPRFGFDPSEVSIPWKLLTEKGYRVHFATPDGKKAVADQYMLNGKGLGPFGFFLKARQDAVEAHGKMEVSEAFNRPLTYGELNEAYFSGLLLPGGHDKGVREYLESLVLQHVVSSFFESRKPVAAICHGVVLAARSQDALSGKSVLYDYKTTALNARQERLAFHLTRPWRQDYYLTYPGMTVEMEVTAALHDHQNFLEGPAPVRRDSLKHLSRGFAVVDRNYVSARWPGDVYCFTMEFIQLLEKRRND